MASSYSTDLKLELMVTGENSGTWGDKTNTNLNLLQQAIAGYQSIALTSTNTTLAMTNATISDARNAVIKFTGTLSANTTVYVDTGIEKTYTIENATSGAFTLALNQVGGASVIWATTDKSVKQIYLNGTDAVDTGLVSATGVATLTNKTLTSPKINEINDTNGNEEIKFTTTASAVNELTIANAATGNAPEISATGNDTNIDIKITPKGTGKINLDGIKFPNADGTSGQVLSTDGAGNLSFTTAESSPANLQSSFILAANKSTTIRNAVSRNLTTGEIGAYPVSNEFNTSTITTITTTNSNIFRSLDGTHAILLTSANLSSAFYTGVYTPHDGTPVIGTSSISVSIAGTTLGTSSGLQYSQGFSYGSNLFIVATGGCSRTPGEGSNPFGMRLTQFTVNTSGNLTMGSSIADATTNNAIESNSTAAQINNTILVYYAGSTALAKIFAISSNLTTLTATLDVDAARISNTGKDMSEIGYTNAGLIYFPSGNTVFFQSVNATASTLTTIASQSINFVHTISSYTKVGQLRWLARYSNATTGQGTYTVFDVNATTLAFTSISTTESLPNLGTLKFLASASEYTNSSINTTTAVTLASNINTLGLSTNGDILGVNVAVPMSPNVTISNAFKNTNDANLAVLAFINTSLQYRNFKINAAATDSFNLTGIATANDTTSPATLITSGIVPGYTGLSINATYYANLADGALTTNPTAVTVGTALTSTQIKLAL